MNRFLQLESDDLTQPGQHASLESFCLDLIRSISENIFAKCFVGTESYHHTIQTHLYAALTQFLVYLLPIFHETFRRAPISCWQPTIYKSMFRPVKISR